MTLVPVVIIWFALEQQASGRWFATAAAAAAVELWRPETIDIVCGGASCSGENDDDDDELIRKFASKSDARRAAAMGRQSVGCWLACSFLSRRCSWLSWRE